MRARVLLATGGALVALLGGTVPAQASPAVTKTEALKLVKKGVLKKGDLSGFNATPYASAPTDAQHEASIRECLGVPMPTSLAHKDSDSFTKGRYKIDSSADVLAKAKYARADAKLVQSKKFPGCYAQELRKSLVEEGISASKVGVKLVPITVPGADVALAFRYNVVGTARGVRVHVVGYDLGAVVGPIEISIDPVRVDGVDPKTDQGVGLLKILVARVRAA